jgi:hypothetical protein
MILFKKENLCIGASAIGTQKLFSMHLESVKNTIFTNLLLRKTNTICSFENKINGKTKVFSRNMDLVLFAGVHLLEAF